MKLLTNKKQKELINDLAACQLIINDTVGLDPEVYKQLTNKFCGIAYEIGGIEGMRYLRKIFIDISMKSKCTSRPCGKNLCDNCCYDRF